MNIYFSDNHQTILYSNYKLLSCIVGSVGGSITLLYSLKKNQINAGRTMIATFYSTCSSKGALITHNPQNL